MGLRSVKEAVRPFYLRWLYFPLFPGSRPAHFQDCWTYPVDELNPAGGVPPELLFLPMTDWHTRIQRTQHLARMFAAAGHRCFYLNPHLGREFPRPYAFSNSPRVHRLDEHIAELHMHLPLEPVFHERLLSNRESDQIASGLADIFQAAGTKKLVQIVSFPVWLAIAERIRDRFGFPIVYDCHDVLSGFRNIATEIIDAEAELFSTSDLVIFSARRLMTDNIARHASLQDKSLLVRNAVDESWLETSSRMEHRRAAKKPMTIGYVGALDFWFDVESMGHTAATHPEWHFVLIGRVEDKRVEALRRFPNVRFIGEIPHSELHPYVSQFTAALIPFVRNELTMGTNPIKLYEYFSYGLPVVGAKLPELEEFGKLVYLYEGPEDFAAQVARACSEHDAGLEAERIRVAHTESWSARVEQLTAAFRNLPGAT
jgi:glycosyltransferase involved in cell wall biosynthesis